MSVADVYREEQITVAQQAIYQITDIVLTPVEDGWSLHKGDICSEIRFAHLWRGTLRLECARNLAVVLSSLMLSLDTDKVSESDMVDVVGEILNTIAGNLKCLMPGDTELSVPSASVAKGKRSCICGAPDGCREQSEVLLEGDAGMLRLSLIHCA